MNKYTHAHVRVHVCSSWQNVVLQRELLLTLTGVKTSVFVCYLAHFVNMISPESSKTQSLRFTGV